MSQARSGWQMSVSLALSADGELSSAVVVSSFLKKESEWAGSVCVSERERKGFS